MQVSDSNRIYDKYSNEMVKKINAFKFKLDVDAERKRDLKESSELDRTLRTNHKLMFFDFLFLIFWSIADDFHRVMSGECNIEKLCLKCLKVPKGNNKEEHPFFIGSLCKECSV